MAGVVTEDEEWWESHSKENLLPRIARRAFTMCQCSQPSCALRVRYSPLIGAMREQLSSLILLVTISDVIDVFLLTRVS